MTQQARRAAPMAVQIQRDFGLSPEAQALVRDGQSPQEYAARLADLELHEDAFRFLAQTLTKRQAVWWGCMCAWEAAQSNPSKEDQEVLATVIRWALEPSEENRRRAEIEGKKTNGGTPASALALAAFWSGGSMSAPDLPPVEPSDDLTATGVAAAVMMASASGATEQLVRQFIAFSEPVTTYRHTQQGSPT